MSTVQNTSRAGKVGFRALSETERNMQQGSMTCKICKGLITGVIGAAILFMLFSAGGCQSDGKLEWSNKILRKGESTEARNTGNCQKVYSWGNKD